MEIFSLSGSPKTPTIEFNPANGQFLIGGKSIPENAVEFYKPVNEWLDAFAQTNHPPIQVDLKLEYFNTSSSKCLLDVFKRLENLNQRNKVTLNWYYDEEDEDMLEVGEDYQAILKLPINLIPFKS
jgi:hypothetical protein